MQCPKCKASLIINGDNARCTVCGAQYSVMEMSRHFFGAEAQGINRQVSYTAALDKMLRNYAIQVEKQIVALPDKPIFADISQIQSVQACYDKLPEREKGAVSTQAKQRLEACVSAALVLHNERLGEILSSIKRDTAKGDSFPENVIATAKEEQVIKGGLALGDGAFYYDGQYYAANTGIVITRTVTEQEVYNGYICVSRVTDLCVKREGKTVYFGTYPQSKVTDVAIIAALNKTAGTLPTAENAQGWTSYGYYKGINCDSDGYGTPDNIESYMWYMDKEYGGNRYRGVYFTYYRPYFTNYSSSADYSYQPDNGYATGIIYWFRYDPIRWNIVAESGGYATILADLILDSQDYYYQWGYGATRSRTDYQGNTAEVYANNYQYSAIRTWLNETFYNTAFTSLQQSLIQVVTVDNSASTTKDRSNQYACNNTNDKVWLLSYREAFGTYFNSDSARCRQGTDYAKAQGLFAGCWWLRSSNLSNSFSANSVNIDGYVNDFYVNFTYRGALPALKISLI